MLLNYRAYIKLYIGYTDTYLLPSQMNFSDTILYVQNVFMYK